jgi:hypothetical protein
MIIAVILMATDLVEDRVAGSDSVLELKCCYNESSQRDSMVESVLLCANQCGQARPSGRTGCHAKRLGRARCIAVYPPY